MNTTHRPKSVAGLLFAAIGALMFLAVLPVRAQGGLVLLDSDVDYDFGQRIIFRARLSRSQDFDRVFLLYRPEGQYDTRTVSLSVDPAGRVTHVHDVTADPLPPFATVHYWLQAEGPGGEQYISPSESFDYLDDRHDWRLMVAGLFRVHWYEGDPTLAQKVIDTAQTAWSELGLPLSDSADPEAAVRLEALEESGIDIYVYASAQALQSTLAQGGPSWVAGHADPELRVVLVSLPPGPDQSFEVERQIPHELAHIHLYARTGPGYHSLPMWLSEGLASINELYPNPNYPLLLSNAARTESLLPLSELCHRFPTSASEALLAYAQSASFTRYLELQFGRSKLGQLIDSYADGKSCARGVEDPYGVSLAELERDWRQAAFAENPWRDLAPWIAIGILLLLPFPVLALFSSRKGPQPEDAAGEQHLASTGRIGSR